VRLLFAVVLALLAPAASAQTDSEFEQGVEQTVAADGKLWKNVGTVVRRYQAAPAGWSRIEGHDFTVALSFPCVPKRSDVAAKPDAPAVERYFCKVGHKGYMLHLMRQQIPREIGAQTFLAIQDRDVLDAIAGHGATGKLIPITNIVYSTVRGRDSRIVSSIYNLEKRVLLLPDAVIVLQVSDDPNHSPGRQDTFFNSLELKPAQ